MRKNEIRNAYLELTYKFTSVGVVTPPNDYNFIDNYIQTFRSVDKAG